LRIAIVGLGPSAYGYIRDVERAGDWRKLYDEVWAINGFINIIQCTRGFAMDDVRVQEARAQASNTKIGNMLEAYKRHPGPIYTSREYPEYPSLRAYPLEAVLNEFKVDYFNSTIAYAIALGVYERAETIAMYGADYTFADRHIAEKGRGCCEFWLGVASARGINVAVHRSSTLMDANENERLYGYDTQAVKREIVDGRIRLSFEDKPAPTAEQIEQRYFKG
jgi:hypothetical protein